MQFTPDLMPSDITGHGVLDSVSRELRVVPGPVYTNLLLADEINRAPAKTQSALLELMQEYQVTLEGRAMPVAGVYPNFAQVARYAWLAADRRLSEMGIRTAARVARALTSVNSQSTGPAIRSATSTGRRRCDATHFDQVLNAAILLAYVALREGDAAGARCYQQGRRDGRA